MYSVFLFETEAFEMWLFRRLLKINWDEHITNEGVLRRNTSYLGHIYRAPRYTYKELIVEGKINVRRGPGCRKGSWMKSVRKWTRMSTLDLIRTTQDREQFANIVDNLE